MAKAALVNKNMPAGIMPITAPDVLLITVFHFSDGGRPVKPNALCSLKIIRMASGMSIIVTTRIISLTDA